MGLCRRHHEVPDEIKVSVPLSDPFSLCGRRKNGIEEHSRRSRLELPDYLNIGTNEKAYQVGIVLGLMFGGQGWSCG